MFTEIREYDDDTQNVTIQIGNQTSTRSYTAEEIAAAQARKAPVTVEATLNTDAKAAISSLTTSITTLQAIAAKANADIGPADTKTVARESRRVARQVVRLTRLLTRQFDTADVGPE